QTSQTSYTFQTSQPFSPFKPFKLFKLLRLLRLFRLLKLLRLLKLPHQLHPPFNNLLLLRWINGVEGYIGNIIVDTGAEFTAIFIATVPVDVDGALTARLVFVHFLAPTVVDPQEDLFHKARASCTALQWNDAAES